MMLLAHGAFGLCPLEFTALVAGAGGLWMLRFQLGWWCKKLIGLVQGV
jgi:hypothetical protein